MLHDTVSLNHKNVFSYLPQVVFGSADSFSFLSSDFKMSVSLPLQSMEVNNTCKVNPLKRNQTEKEVILKTVHPNTFFGYKGIIIIIISGTHFVKIVFSYPLD